jgi:hypothetical protein
MEEWKVQQRGTTNDSKFCYYGFPPALRGAFVVYLDFILVSNPGRVHSCTLNVHFEHFETLHVWICYISTMHICNTNLVEVDCCRVNNIAGTTFKI